MPEHHHHGHEIDSGVVADWSDHRDARYSPSSSSKLPRQFELTNYRLIADETWHQRGEECTGFSLAAIANFLIRSKHGDAELPSVSRRMLYEMAQKYDGEMHVQGSTLRGALKGWSRVGVASDQAWPYHPDDEDGAVHGGLTLARLLDGRTRPLMGYQRVAGERVDSMQRALVDGHPLYVAARTHVGWYRLFLSGSHPVIERTDDDAARGIHAFVIVGYDERGFLLHNSWGPEWGDDGYAVLPYDQWRWGATDAWVVDAGIDPAPAASPPAAAVTPPPSAAAAKKNYRDMWPHLVVLNDDGALASTGLYEMDAGSVKTMLYLFDQYATSHEWSDRALAVIADGGALSTASTIDQLRTVRDELLAAHIYPIILVWETAWQDQLEQELNTWIAHRAADQLSPRLASNIAAAESRCRAAWDAVHHRSHRATAGPGGGAHLLAQSIAYKRGQRYFDLHVVSHGAGDYLMNCLAGLLATPITSAVAVAPKTSVDAMRMTYGEMLACGCLHRMTVLTVDEQTAAADTFLRLASDVWSLDGSAMRRAGRAARETHTWPVESVPVAGITGHLVTADVAARSRDRLHLAALENSPAQPAFFDPAFATQLTAMLVAAATPSSNSPKDLPVISRDPIAGAKARLTRQRSAAVDPAQARALTLRDPLARAQAAFGKD